MHYLKWYLDFCWREALQLPLYFVHIWTGQKWKKYISARCSTYLCLGALVDHVLNNQEPPSLRGQIAFLTEVASLEWTMVVELRYVTWCMYAFHKHSSRGPPSIINLSLAFPLALHHAKSRSLLQLYVCILKFRDLLSSVSEAWTPSVSHIWVPIKAHLLEYTEL